MNTIDATPKRSFDDRATLCPQHYPFVNGMLRTNTLRLNKRSNSAYGKQILNEECSARETYEVRATKRVRHEVFYR
jgi:hypothetical protein